MLLNFRLKKQLTLEFRSEGQIANVPSALHTSEFSCSSIVNHFIPPIPFISSTHHAEGTR